ncbi:MAG: hypothetical protein JSW00_10085 [Thermoplasmata archaeon]|nr:MAG: hypothetical protein JSW00_10085 [Thermoplasmata archaeon]
MKKIIIPLLYFIFLSFPVFAQEVTSENLAIKIDRSIKIDGLLNESIWNSAPDASTFLLIQSDRTDSHKVRTTVKILFDNEFVYFGFLCYDDEPEKIEAEALNIDMDLRDTDSIYIVIDTPKEVNSFLYFATNYLGVKSDGLLSRDGETANYRWDGSWKTFSQKTDFGWSSEVAIELDSILDDPLESKTFELALSRLVPRLDSIFRSGGLDPAFRSEQLEQLKVLNLVEPKLGVNITPYAMTKLESGDKTEPLAGINGHYRFSQRMLGRLTIYPDFATVEPDQEQLNLTPYELYIPEKRNFFLEGPETFQQQADLFYSKRIGDLYGGVEMSGKFGVYEFSGMSAQSRRDDYLDEDTANFSLLSLKRRSMANSSEIGFLAANKLVNKRNIGTAGIYANLELSNKFKLEGQFALGYEEERKGKIAFSFGPSYDTRTFHVHLHYRQIDDNFSDRVNHVGFIPDDNRRELDSSINKTFSFKGEILDRIRYISNYNVYWGIDGILRSWQIDQGFIVNTKMNFILSGTYTQEYKYNEFFLEPEYSFESGEGEWRSSGDSGEYVYRSTGTSRVWVGEAGIWTEKYIRDFRNNRIRIQSQYYAGEWRLFGLSLTVGSNYGSSFMMLEVSKKFRLSKNFFSEYYLQILEHETEIFFRNATIHVIRLTSYVSKKLFLKLFFQSRSDISKVNIHLECLYNIEPVGTIQLVYQKGAARFGEVGTQGHALFFKFSHKF